MGEPGRLQSTGVQRVGHDWTTSFFFFLSFSSPSNASLCRQDLDPYTYHTTCSVQSLSRVWTVTPRTTAYQTSLSTTNSESTQTHVHWVSDAIQPSHPLLSPSPPAPNPSQGQGLFNESALLIRWPKYWSFSFNISPSNEHPRLISFRMDWLDLLAVQGPL